MESVKLASGYEMPILGLGTWQTVKDGTKEMVRKALELGYRSLDTADRYENEKEIGEVLKEAKVKRKEIFITSKVWPSDLRYGDVMKVCERILKNLQTSYIDLYLIHWPNKDIPMEESFKAFKRLVGEGKVRSVGVSNFTIKHLEKAKEISEVPISVNQVEYHVYLNQERLLEYCKENNIVITAYCPLGNGGVVEDAVLKEVGGKYGKSAAQVALRWLVQKGMVVIPKSGKGEHLRENMDIFEWKLEEEDMERVNKLDRNYRVCDPGFAEF